MGISSVAPDFNPAKPQSESLVEKTRAVLTSLGVTPTSRILIAVSGGPDSMALLHILEALREQQSIGELTIAHINHGLRGDASDRDEQLVTTLAAQWKLPLEVRRVDTKAESLRTRKGIEETARKIRYEFFEELVTKLNIDVVITAHTANDQAETVIMNMVRGAGVRGLSGIPPKRAIGTAFVIRPWLNVTRDEIAEYIALHNIEAAHDTSNDELTYQRNRVRHGVIPALEDAYPDRVPVKSLSQLAERMRDLNSFLNVLTEEKLESLSVLSSTSNGLLLSGLRILHGYLLHTIIEAWINSADYEFETYRLTAIETHKIDWFLASDHPMLELRYALRLRKEGNILCIERNAESMAFMPFLLLPEQQRETPYGTLSMTIRSLRDPNYELRVTNEADESPIRNSQFVIRNSAYFDAGKMGQSDFLVRPWHDGDRISPFGMRGKTKLVSDILNEAGIRGRNKGGYPIVARASDPADILWIPGVRRSEAAKVTPETKLMVTFEWIPKE